MIKLVLFCVFSVSLLGRGAMAAEKASSAATVRVTRMQMEHTLKVARVRAGISAKTMAAQDAANKAMTATEVRGLVAILAKITRVVKKAFIYKKHCSAAAFAEYLYLGTGLGVKLATGGLGMNVIIRCQPLHKCESWLDLCLILYMTKVPSF